MKPEVMPQGDDPRAGHEIRSLYQPPPLRRYEVWVRYFDGVPAPSRTIAPRFWFRRNAMREVDSLNHFHRGICGIMGKEPTMEFYVINSRTGEEL